MSYIDTCKVYIAAKICDDGWNPPCKIGVAKNPFGRIAGFQTATPFKIGLFREYNLPCRSVAFDIEEMFHVTQARHRIHGEWFDIIPAKADALMMLGIRVGLRTLADFAKEEIDEILHMVRT